MSEALVETREDVKILSARPERLSKKLDEYAARREAAAIATPETRTVAGTPKSPRPRPRKTTER
jgi:hypothetical protein